MSGIDERKPCLRHSRMRVTDVPLVIDSSNPDVMEAALKFTQGEL